MISNNPIFTHYYQALGWLQNADTIGYMTDSAGNNGGQYFYSINPNTTAVTQLNESGEHRPIVDVYMATGDVRLRLVGDDGTVYSATISDTDNSITIEPKHASNGSFVSCTNGLIRYSDGKYWYEGQEITGLSGTVKAFAAVDSNSYYAITTSGSSFVIYSISDGSANEITTIPGGDNNEFPCFVDSDGKLYFLYYRGTRSSSIVYKVSRDKTVNSRDLHKNNIMAEAFVQSGETVYMLSKDNNLFEVTI